MSKINLVNNDIMGVYQFLNTVDMPPKATRAKVNFMKSLSGIGSDVAADQRSIADEFGGTVSEDGRITYDTPEHNAEANTQISILSMESRDIEESYNDQYKILKEFFEGYDKDIPAMFSNFYITLVDELEKV